MSEAIIFNHAIISNRSPYYWINGYNIDAEAIILLYRSYYLIKSHNIGSEAIILDQNP